MRAPRILLVDDHLDTLQFLESCLSLAGFAVTLAGHAAQALALAPAGFDAVVTDLAMPGMDGRELIRRLRALHGQQAVPIVIVSGQFMRGRLDLEGVGHCALLEKPCDPTALTDTLDALIKTCLHDCASCRLPRETAPRRLLGER